MRIKTAQRWFTWHKWTSLLCTVFLLLLCITGLPLIFHKEIANLNQTLSIDVPSSDTKLDLDTLKNIAESHYPGKKVRFIFWDQEAYPNQVLFDVVETPDAAYANSKYLSIHEYTGALIKETKDEGFLSIMLHLHTDMFAGLPGKLFLGLMGILFIIAIVSGIVLYGRIMKTYDFGLLRKDKSTRLKWLDTHNFLGIVAAAWLFVVGFTGVVNSLSDVILGLWQQGQLAEMTAPYAAAAPMKGVLSSLTAARKIAEEKFPGMHVSVLVYPGTAFTLRSIHERQYAPDGTTAEACTHRCCDGCIHG